MTITDEGLVLGATVLAPMRRDACGTPALVINGAEERILALLAIVYGKTVGARVLDNVRRASKYWGQGERHLASIELALSGLPWLANAETESHRLLFGGELLAAGVAPRALTEACGLDPALFDVIKETPTSRASPRATLAAASGPTVGRRRVIQRSRFALS
jgi:hypothetical protein